MDKTEKLSAPGADYPARTSCGTAHFKQSEFDCHDGTRVPDQFKGNCQVLMQQLEALRAAVGGKPIHVNSGYRTSAYNRKLNGSATNSQHLRAKAADIVVSGYTPGQLKAVIEAEIAAGRMLQGGVGLYPSFVHYDIRGTKSRW